MKIFLQHSFTKNFIPLLVCFSFLSNLNAQQWIALGPNDSTQFPNCGSEYRSLVVDKQGVIYVGYLSQPNYFDSSKLLVSKYENGKWEQLGATIDYLRNTEGYSLALDSNNNLYIAYCKTPFAGPQNYVSYVRKFDGQNWGLVGGSIANVLIDFHSLIFSRRGTMYLACFSNFPVVERFNGSQWIQVGDFTKDQPNIRIGHSDNYDVISITTDTNDVPIVCVRNASKKYNITVLKFDSVKPYPAYWSKVGNSFTDSANGFSMAINRLNILYLAYSHFHHDNAITKVKYLMGNTWKTVGAQDSEISNSYYPRIAFDKKDTLYLSYLSPLGIGAPVLKRLNQNSWIMLTDTSWQTASFLDLTIDNNNKPIIFGYGNNVPFFVMRYDNSQWNNLNEYGIGNEIGWKYNDGYNLFVDKNRVPHLSLFDPRKNKYSTFHFNDTTWLIDADPGQGPIQFAEDTSGEMYGAYAIFEDTGYYMDLQIIRFNGTAWIPVGNKILTHSNFGYYYLRISKKDNYPYIAYIENTSYKFTVWKYNQVRWTELPEPPSPNINQLNYFSFTIDGKGKMYAYTDGYDHVLTFDGTEWVFFEQQSISNLGVYIFAELVTDADDSLYMAAQFNLGGYPSATVYKWNGQQWTIVGQPLFAHEYQPYPYSSGFKINGLTPYIAVQDANSGQERLMKFNGQSWVFLSDSSATDNCTYSMDYSFDRSGNVYIVYQELGGAFAWKIKDSSYLSDITPNNYSSENSIFIFPNPNQGHFTLSVNLGSLTGSNNTLIEIYNDEGILLMTIKPNFRNAGMKQNVDMPNFPPGVYYAGIKNQSINQFKKFIIW